MELNYYSDDNRRIYFSAPQFTKFRHRFQGPRESQKINLEIDQLYYSIRKLYDKQEEFQYKFVEKADLLLGGYPADLDYPGSNTFPSAELFPDLDLSGIEEFAERLDKLQRRVQALEA